MVVTRSQTRATKALLDLAVRNMLDETPLSRTTGFQEYATAYKWVMIGTAPIEPAVLAHPVLDLIKIKWAELPEHERKVWNDKAALYRFLAEGLDDLPTHWTRA
jgi:hypothetical protein